MTAETAHKTRVLLRLAEYVRTDLVDDPDAAALVADIVKILVGPHGAGYWSELLDDLKRRDLVEDTVAYRNRATELSIVNAEIAATLWAVLNGTRLYCQVCIDSLSAEPHEVAAKALPVWGNRRDGRKACEPHCMADWARAS